MSQENLLALNTVPVKILKLFKALTLVGKEKFMTPNPNINIPNLYKISLRNKILKREHLLVS